MNFGENWKEKKIWQERLKPLKKLVKKNLEVKTYTPEKIEIKKKFGGRLTPKKIEKKKMICGGRLTHPKKLRKKKFGGGDLQLPP